MVNISGRSIFPPTYISNNLQILKVTSGSHHLESVPCSTPIAQARGHAKNRDYAYVTDDLASYNLVLENAEIPEELVPIRLDMELDNVKLRDFFCYNRNDKLISPEMVLIFSTS